MRCLLFFLLILLVVQLPGMAVVVREDPRLHLERLRAELDSLETLLQSKQSGERSLVERIGDLDQQIATRRRLLDELKAQRLREEASIRKYEGEIREAGKRLSRAQERLAKTTGEVLDLENLIRRRAVFVYEKGESESLQFLLAAESPGDLLRRQVYVRRIQQRDRRNLSLLRQAKARQAQTRAAIDMHLADLNRTVELKRTAARRSEALLAESREEEKRLLANRRTNKKLLSQVRKDAEALRTLIAERRQAAKQIEDWITTLEQQRIGGGVQEIRVTQPTDREPVVHEVRSFPSFAKARGSLPWPAKGRVVRRFGLEKNKVTGTVTENPGIDLETDDNAEVIAVQGGVCTRITFLRGFGTTMLIDHGNGYYTVYTHLGEVWVREGDSVMAGQVIGTVGTTSTGEQPLLHFQIWKKRHKEDPLNWLR